MTIGASNRIRIVAFFVIFLAIDLSAQVRWSGIFDFEIQKGGKDSRSDLNGLTNDRLQLSARQFQLFVDADVTPSVAVSAMIVNAPSRPFELKGIEFQLAYVTFKNLVGQALSISVGKIFTPFGQYTKRQLAPDNPLIGKPLLYTYGLNISPVTGYLDSAGALSVQSQFGARMTTMYNGGYYVGAEAFGSFGGGFIDYDVALMNAPLAPILVDYNVDNDLAVHGRLGINPAIWTTVGFSFATGSYMQSASQNLLFESRRGSVSQFKQTTFGADLRLSYLYFELNAEYISNSFDAPYLVTQGGDGSGNGLQGRTSMELKSSEFFADLKVEAPFYPGLFIAGRYNRVSPSEIVDPARFSSTYQKSIPWSAAATRYGVGIGFKPERSVLIKLAYENTDIDVKPAPVLDYLACALVVTF